MTLNFFKKPKVIFISILVLFILIRFFGVDLSYHQDEQKYVARGVALQGVRVTSGHPPLLGVIMTGAGFFFGDKFFRLMPLLFGVGSLIILYILMRVLLGVHPVRSLAHAKGASPAREFEQDSNADTESKPGTSALSNGTSPEDLGEATSNGTSAALWASFLYAVSPYGVWASLMVDVDGAVLPFFAFSAFLFYTFWHQRPGKKKLYAVLCILSLILGVFIKLSFVLVFAALGIDLAIRYWRKGHRKAIYITVGALVVLPLLALGFISLLAKTLPSFDFGETIKHAQGYFRFSGRNYSQIAFQLFKAFLYLSPLLVVPLLFVTRQIFGKLKLLVLYLGFAFIFYVLLFDFSSAALDKYLMVAVLPLSAISGAVINEISNIKYQISKRYILSAVGVVAVLFAAQLMPHFVPALYPKGEWLGRIFKLQWNILIPFMGGSGPTGFYASWLFMAMAWIAAVGAAILALVRKNTVSVRPFLLIVGIVYSAIMLSELLFGFPHGSSKKVLSDALRYIEKTPSVQSVITFNDAGGYYLNKMGKYERRMYAVPKYEKLYEELLAKHQGHLLVVDIPRIYENSVYWRYISSCRPEFVSRSGYISATLYDCAKHSKL